VTPDLSRTVLFLLTLVLASAFGASTGTPLRAAEPELPDFWDTRERFPEVDLSRLRAYPVSDDDGFCAVQLLG
jgi:hypothetical protein